MKRNFSKVLFASLATVASAMAADCGKDTNLAHIKFRDYYSLPYVATGGAANMAMENKEREDAFGGCFSVMGFWEQSINGSRGSKELAKGYGVDSLADFTVTPAAATAGADATAATGTVDVRRLIHNHDGGNGTDTWSTGKIALDARHRRYGVNVQYMQCLSNFYEGLKFKVSTAALGVRNELVNNHSDEVTGTGSAISVKQFYRGDHGQVGATTDLQAPLAYGKMLPDRGSATEYHFNDVQACLGLSVVESDNANVCVGISGVIPVGREMDGRFLMEPQVGNRHFKLGAEVDVCACLAEGADYKASVNMHGLWHYAFKREHKFRLPSHNTINHGHYHLAYKKNSAQGSALEPVMNHIAKRVDVKPGNMFDLNTCLTFEKGCLCVDAGYNFFYSQDEKNDVCGFEDATYYVVKPDYNVSTDARDGTVGTAVAKSDYNWNAPSQALHHVYASVGFMCKDWCYPASINVAGGYEFAHNRTRTREVWSVAVKGSVCF